MLKKVVDICKRYRVNYQVGLEAIIKCGFGVCGSCGRRVDLFAKMAQFLTAGQKGVKNV
ncbi:hypothetical protein KKD61_02320 [Patescibacteria group bacterium]|nr:hypothetical protein [Patescibacteria group bacterium]